MDSAKLNDWMQVIGIFAVVASLVFVGMQMKQDREIAIASTFHQRVDTALELWISFEDNEYDILRMGNLFVDNPNFDGVFGDAATPEMFGVAYISARKTFAVLENHHYQYVAGFYNEETWGSFRKQISNILRNNRFARAIVRHDNAFARPEFIELCQQILDELGMTDS